VNTLPPPTFPRASTHADDQLLTLQEVAALVRVPVATLRYWRHLGTGPRSFRIGRCVRYWRTEVVSWLDHQSSEAADSGRGGANAASGRAGH
jgi:predicted DNA-binding transcriptional regulator AlpA